MEKIIRKQIVSYSKSTLMCSFIRLGYVIRGVIYSFIGFFALEIVLGLRTTASNSVEILTFFHTLFFGDIFLIVFTLGLVGYTFWGIIRATIDIIDPRDVQSPSFFQRAGYLISAWAYASLIPVSLYLLFPSFFSKHTTDMNSEILYFLSLPYGQIIVFILGLSVIVGGV